MAGGQDKVEAAIQVHGTVVALQEKGLLIVGPSGSGKSALALRLISLGARLVADDQVLVSRTGDGPVAQAPTNLRGLLEARFLGILRLPFQTSTRLNVIVDLGEAETQRLPQRKFRDLAGFALPLVQRSHIDHLAPALFCYLMGERQD